MSSLIGLLRVRPPTSPYPRSQRVVVAQHFSRPDVLFGHLGKKSLSQGQKWEGHLFLEKDLVEGSLLQALHLGALETSQLE